MLQGPTGGLFAYSDERRASKVVELLKAGKVTIEQYWTARKRFCLVKLTHSSPRRFNIGIYL